MTDERRKRRNLGVATAAVIGVLAFAPSLQAFDFHNAAGSWFGRAVPVSGQTVCPAGAPGCPVPTEIIMVFTVFADGTFIGIDSNIFKGGTHSTAHGQWAQSGPNSIHATFTLLQSTNGIFIGGFKNLFDATMVSADQMTGAIHAFLYNYTDANGNSIDGPDGLPTPSPLGAPSACVSTPGCTYLGEFTFKADRVAVQ